MPGPPRHSPAGSSVRTACDPSSTRACPAIRSTRSADAPVPGRRGRRDARVRGRRRPGGRPGRHRRADAARADRLARQRPHDGRPPAVDVPAPARARRELLEAGITPGLLRVSVGLEDLEDLQADFAAAPSAAAPAPTPRRRPTPAVASRSRVIATPAAVSAASCRPRAAESRRPARAGPVAPADVGRLRRRPDHRPGAARRRRHDHPAAARLRLPLRRPTTRPRWTRSTPATTRCWARRRRRPRAAERLLDVPVGLVQRRADRARHLDRRLHARSDAPAVARRRRTSGSTSPSRSSTRACRTARR